MEKEKINEDFLLLLVENNGVVNITEISIDRHFEYETNTLRELCQGSMDNISEIIKFINNSLRPKFPNKIFNYCKKLDMAYQSVYVYIDIGISEIKRKQELIYTNQKKAIQDRPCKICYKNKR